MSNKLPPPRRLVQAPPPRPPRPQAPSPNTGPAPVQQIIIQPKHGVTTGQVILIGLGVLGAAAVGVFAVRVLAVDAGTQAATPASVPAPQATVAINYPSTPTPPPVAPAVTPAAAPPSTNAPAGPSPAATPTAAPPSTTAPAAPSSAAVPAEEAIEPRAETVYRWEYEDDADPMTGQVTRRAQVYSENKAELSFPYQGGTYAALRLRKHPRHGQQVTVVISRGQLVCGLLSCRVLVRFDENPPIQFRALPPADHSSDVLFFEPEAKFIKEVKKAKRVAIELNFFQHGSHIFFFNTGGLVWD